MLISKFIHDCKTENVLTGSSSFEAVYTLSFCEIGLPDSNLKKKKNQKPNVTEKMYRIV